LDRLILNNLLLFYDDKTKSQEQIIAKDIKRLNSGIFYLMKNKQMHNFIKTNPIVFKVFAKTDLIIFLNYLPYFLFLPLSVIKKRGSFKKIIIVAGRCL